MLLGEFFTRPTCLFDKFDVVYHIGFQMMMAQLFTVAGFSRRHEARESPYHLIRVFYLFRCLVCVNMFFILQSTWRLERAEKTLTQMPMRYMEAPTN